jgi:hypothetical protein
MGTKKTQLASRVEPFAADLGTLPPIPDRRAVEGILADLTRMLGGGLPAGRKGVALEEAQDVMYEAWEATGPRRVNLACHALDTCPYCADA